MLIFMEGGKPENLEENPCGKGENNTSNKLNLHVETYDELFGIISSQNLMSEPEEVTTMTGQKIQRKCSVGKSLRAD